MKKNWISTRLPWLVLGLMALASMSASSPQCAKVGDNVIGARAGANLEQAGGVAACVRACNETANARIDAEQDLHVANVQACNGDEACLQEEATRHEAEMEDIAADRSACKEICHNQGSGSGGQ